MENIQLSSISIYVFNFLNRHLVKEKFKKWLYVQFLI